jgi:hypothetical protein
MRPQGVSKQNTILRTLAAYLQRCARRGPLWNNQISPWIAIGVGIGIAIDQVASGIAIGVAIGVANGVAMNSCSGE